MLTFSIIDYNLQHTAFTHHSLFESTTSIHDLYHQRKQVHGNTITCKLLFNLHGESQKCCNKQLGNLERQNHAKSKSGTSIHHSSPHRSAFVFPTYVVYVELLFLLMQFCVNVELNPTPLPAIHFKLPIKQVSSYCFWFFCHYF